MCQLSAHQQLNNSTAVLHIEVLEMTVIANQLRKRADNKLVSKV